MGFDLFYFTFGDFILTAFNSSLQFEYLRDATGNAPGLRDHSVACGESRECRGYCSEFESIELPAPWSDIVSARPCGFWWVSHFNDLLQ